MLKTGHFSKLALTPPPPSQELLRVLFDALEEEWAGTPLSSAIQDLYQGELLDYVRCTVCKNESTRTVGDGG